MRPTHADKLSAGSMQSHNLQYAPARYVLQFVKEHVREESGIECKHAHVPTSVTPDATLRIFPTAGSFPPCLVELVGIEPTTYGLQSRALPTELMPLSRASLDLVGLVGFEPTTPPYQDGALN